MKKTGLILILILFSFSAPAFAKKERRGDGFYRLMERATVGLEQAVTRVMVQMNGIPYRAQIERIGKRKVIFEVHAMLDNEAAIVLVDPESGQIINATAEPFWHRWSDTDDKKAAQSTELSMVQAIGIAQKACSGKALRARIETRKQQVVFVVIIVQRRGRCEVLVDATSGDYTIENSRSRKH